MGVGGRVLRVFHGVVHIDQETSGGETGGKTEVVVVVVVVVVRLQGEVGVE